MGKEGRREAPSTVCAGGAALLRASNLLATGSDPKGHLLQSWPPPRLAAGTKAAPGSTRATRSPLAARWLQLQTRSELGKGSSHTATDTVPAYSIPWARSFLCNSAPGSRGTRSRILHRVLVGAAAAAQVRDQLSLAPPPRAAPRQSPPPDAPRSPRRARAPPARVRAPHLARWNPMPTDRRAAVPTPAGHTDGKVPAPTELSSMEAMAARGIPPKGLEGAHRSWPWVRARAGPRGLQSCSGKQP